MVKSFLRYFKGFLVFSGIVFVVALVVVKSLDISLFYFWLSNIVLVMGGSLGILFTSNAVQHKGKSFVHLVIPAMVIKLIFYLLYCFVIIFLATSPVKNDIAYFLITYFLLVIYDIIMVLKRPAVDEV